MSHVGPFYEPMNRNCILSQILLNERIHMTHHKIEQEQLEKSLHHTENNIDSLHWIRIRSSFATGKNSHQKVGAEEAG